MIRLLHPETGPVEDLVAYCLTTHRQANSRLMLNMVTSLDGATAIRGEATLLGDDDDRALFLALRAACDVVLVGAGTVRAEDYGPVRLSPHARNAREAAGLSPLPRLAIVSRKLDLDPAARVFSAPESPPYLITGEDAPPGRLAALSERAEILMAGDSGADPVRLTSILFERGHTVILCEGGPRFNSHLVTSGLVDELNLTLSPVIVGGYSDRLVQGAPRIHHEYRLDRLMAGERMLFARYSRIRERP